MSLHFNFHWKDVVKSPYRWSLLQQFVSNCSLEIFHLYIFMILGKLMQCMNTRYEVPSIWGYISFQISYWKEECHWYNSDHWRSQAEITKGVWGFVLSFLFDHIMRLCLTLVSQQKHRSYLHCSPAARPTLSRPCFTQWAADLSEHHCKTRLATEIIWISMKSKEKSGFSSGSKSQLDIFMHSSSFVISSNWSII